MTLFEEKVYRAVRRIPKGKVSTYKDIAKRIGFPRAARAVGNALSKNPNLIEVPCHRVVRSDGFVGRYVKGTAEKVRILKREGIIIKNNKIEKMPRYFTNSTIFLKTAGSFLARSAKIFRSRRTFFFFSAFMNLP